MSELGELTPGERLMIQRRRLEQTQLEAAQRFGVSFVTYNAWENDKLGRIPEVKISGLKPFECCLLYRRRANMSQGQVAEELPTSRWWLSLMERGSVCCDILVKYWEARNLWKK